MTEPAKKKRGPGRPKKQPEVESNLDSTVEAAVKEVVEEANEEVITVYPSFTIETDGASWFAIRMWRNRATDELVSKDNLTPRGTSRTNAILALESYQLQMRQGPPDEYLSNG